MKNSNENKSKKSKNVVILALFLLTVVASFIALQQFNAKEVAIEQAIIERELIEKQYGLSFTEIEKNLFEITAHEDNLRSTMSEKDQKGSLSAEQRIQQEILIIEHLIANNDNIIADLKVQVGVNDEKLVEFEAKNKHLEKKLSLFVLRVNELENLNIDLAQELNRTKEEKLYLEDEVERQTNEVVYLNNAMVGKDKTIEIQTKEIDVLGANLNRSYYLVGNYKDLKELDIVEKDGGIIGIGATKQLKSDFDKGQFIQIDRSKYTTIPVFSKKAELATNHPSNSYKWVEDENGIKWLEITKPASFWEHSKYLVILTNKELDMPKAA